MIRRVLTDFRFLRIRQIFWGFDACRRQKKFSVSTPTKMKCSSIALQIDESCLPFFLEKSQKSKRHLKLLTNLFRKKFEIISQKFKEYLRRKL